MLICPRCGNQNPNGATRCQACGVQFAAAPRPAYPPQGGYAQQPAFVPGKGMAIASMVCGIVSFFVGIWGVILGVLAIVFSVVAKNKGNRSGMATAGLVLGCVGVGISVLFWIACGSVLSAASSMPYLF